MCIRDRLFLLGQGSVFIVEFFVDSKNGAFGRFQYNIRNRGIFFSAKSRTLLIYRYQKKEDTLRNLYEKKKEKLISYICFLASLGLKVTILFSVILNFLIFPVSESLNLYSNSSTHSLMRYKSIKQLKTKIQEDIY